MLYFELEDYNSGGWYPVEVLWDSQKKRMVMSDLILISKACWMLEKGRHQSDTEDNISNCLKVISDLNVDLQVWGGAERECPLHKFS